MSDMAELSERLAEKARDFLGAHSKTKVFVAIESDDEQAFSVLGVSNKEWRERVERFFGACQQADQK